jgi:hypothetical protein
MLSKFLIKSLQYALATMLSIILSACAAPVVSPTALGPTIVTTTIQPTNTQAPTPTEDLATQRQKIWDEVVRNVNAFNQLVEQEKLLGQVETTHNDETGQDFFAFTGESDKKIRAAHDNLIKEIVRLHEQSLALYKIDYNPTPLPTFSTKEEALNFYYQTMQENQDWLEAQDNAENVLKMYVPDRGGYMSLVSFEQMDWLVLRNEALDQLRMAAELPPELLAQHIAIVEKLDGQPVIASEITALPFYRGDLTFFQYQTQKNYYTLNRDGAVIEIIPMQIPSSDQLTPVTPLNANQLEEKARMLIASIASGTELGTLTSASASKIGSYFFRWEDRTKPLLDDGRSFPFVQVALNQDGELLNYYNTLPLSR